MTNVQQSITESSVPVSSRKIADPETPAAQHVGRGAWQLSDRLDWALSLPVSPPARFVAVTIIKHTNADSGLAWPSVATLVNLTGYTKSTVKTAIRELERGGHFHITRLKVGKVNTSNRYRAKRVGVGQELPQGGAGAAPEPVKEPVKQTHTPRARVSCSVHKREWFKADGKHCHECARERLTLARSASMLPARLRVGAPKHGAVALTDGDRAALARVSGGRKPGRTHAGGAAPQPGHFAGVF